jgi:zinc protease
MRAAIAGVAKDGAPPDLVEAARRQELAQLAFKSDSISGLANSWSEALAFQGAETPDDIGRAYQAVTVDDVNRMARELLEPEHSVVAILTPAQSGKPVMGAGFGGAESFAQAPDKPVALPDWAAAALASLNLPDPGEAPDVSTLPNGLRLIVQPEHVSRTVSVFGMVRQTPSMQEKPGQEGVSGLVNRLFPYGSETLDRIAFQTALDDIAAQGQPGARFTLKVLTPQFEPGMKLLADVQLHPAFPDDAFEVVRRQSAQSLGGMLQSPDYLARRALKTALLPAGDPELREATPETVETLTPADVRAYYASAYRPDATTIVVAGDVTPEEARRVVAETFGAWTASAGAAPPDLPPVGPSKTAQAHVPDSTSVQDSVELAETVPIAVTDPDRYMLMLGNVILGGGFSSRLYRDLRIQSGYVYSVSSDLDFTRTRCEYGVSFGADPENVGKARGLAVRDLKAMQDAPVSEAELTLAKAQMLRRLPMQKASVDSIGGLYLRLADLGLPTDTPQLAAKRYLEADAPAIQAAFRKWLRPDDLAEVVKGPPVAQ